MAKKSYTLSWTILLSGLFYSFFGMFYAAVVNLDGLRRFPWDRDILVLTHCCLFVGYSIFVAWAANESQASISAQLKE